MKKLFLLPLVAMFGLVGCGNNGGGSGGGGGKKDVAISLTSQSLLGYTTENVVYDTQYKTNTVEGVEFAYQQIGAYGSGMQFRNKLADEGNGTKSNLYNTKSLPGTVQSLELTWNSGKKVYDNSNALKITFDTVATFDGANKEVQMLSTTADVLSYTITTNGLFSFVKVEIDDAFTFSMYWDSIVINVHK